VAPELASQEEPVSVELAINCADNKGWYIVAGAWGGGVLC
jgi:hypothetical protein